MTGDLGLSKCHSSLTPLVLTFGPCLWSAPLVRLWSRDPIGPHATALEHGLSVLTANTKHFTAVGWLEVERFEV